MGERITDSFIKAKVKRMQAADIDVGLDGQYGRWRVTNKEGSRDLSPRMPNREIWEWLDAYEQGFGAGQLKGEREVEDAISDMRHGRLE